LSGFKNVLIAKAPTANAVQGTFVERTLSDEPISAARNLEILLSRPQFTSAFHFRFLLADARQAVISGSLAGTENLPSAWFVKVFYPGLTERGGGTGFSIVGEGYISFGFVGVVAWGIGLGLLVRGIWRLSASSQLWVIAYALAVPVIIYSTRADLGNLLSQLIKAIALPLVLFSIAELLMRRRNASPSHQRDSDLRVTNG
jgi:hypothetical protein